MPKRRSFMKRDIKLYNLIFPMWGIYFYAILFPYFFVLLLPANFIVDTVMPVSYTHLTLPTKA